MKTLFRTSLLCTLLIAISCNKQEKKVQEGNRIGNIYISKAQPTPGDEILLRYYSNSEDSTKTKTIINYLVRDKMYASDLDMQDSSGILVGKVQIPDSAVAISFIFSKHGMYDTNQKMGYVIPLYSEEGKAVPGAYASIVNYYNTFGSDYGIQMAVDSAVVLMKNELQSYPELEETYQITYARLLKKKDKDKGMAYTEQRIAQYNNADNLTQKDYDKLLHLYIILNKQKGLDSIQELMIKRFPSSQPALLNYRSKVLKAQTADDKLAVLSNFDEMKIDNQLTRDFIVQTVARAYAKEGEYENFMEYGQQIKGNIRKAYLYNSVARDLAEKGRNLKKAAKFSQKCLEVIQEEQLTLAAKPDYSTRKQYTYILAPIISDYWDTYAYVLYKQGDLEQALEMQKEAISENSSKEVNTHYIQYLIENKNYEQARESSEVFIVDNRAGKEIKVYLKIAYQQTEGSVKGYENYLVDIETRAKNNGREEFRYQMIKEEAPKFEMIDMEGKPISLSSMKGKIVILDFWATWCGPCKESFPGMKISVEKYKNNPDVVFLFVNTFERDLKREERVKGFITQHNYPFHVVYDNGKGNGATAASFGITGIPTKIVIGPEGKIRFRLVGYDGDNAKMVNEISYAVDILCEKS